MHKEFRMGNEAIALGAIAAGVNLISGYPGTPSTEVLETVAKNRTNDCYVPQIFMPLAAQYSTPETKGKNVGIILSGLLTGILASRVVSGIVGEYMGWRFIYFIAAGLMVVCLLIIIRILPDLPSNYQGSYAGLMKSLFSIVKKYPQLRIAENAISTHVDETSLLVFQTVSNKMR